MFKSESNRKFSLNKINFNKLINTEPKDLGLEKDTNSELYIYTSKGYEILNWKIKPKIYIKLAKADEYIRVDLKNKFISDIGELSKLVNVEIYTIIRGSSDHCLIERSIKLEVYNDRKFLKFIPDYLIKNLLKETLGLVSKRFDKQLSKRIKLISNTI